MALIGPVLALLGRFAGKILNTALGWATIMLFGKVSGRKQTFMLLMALGSLVWVVTVAGVLLPDVGTIVLGFVPIPDFVDRGVVRIGMLVLAIGIPLAIGVAAVGLTEGE